MNVVIMNSARKFIGEAAHCLALAEQLRKRGHEATLVVRRGFELEKRAQERGVPTLSLVMNSKFNPLDEWRDLRALRAFITSNKPDLIHCHRGKDHWLAVTYSLVFGGDLPLVRTRHVVVGVQNHVFNRWLYLKRTGRLIAVSSQAGQSFGAMQALLDKRLRVIYSAVDTERFGAEKRSESWRQEHGIAAGQPLVGLIARIQNIKGQSIFLQAAAEIVKQHPEARFLISGAGPAYRFDRLRDYARQLGIADNVLFEGWLEDVEGVIASLDVGVVASLGSEGSSRITYEYMASGVPVVATKVGGIPEILNDGESGLLVSPGQVGELAQAVLKILDSKPMAEKLRSNALDKIRAFHNYDRWIGEIMEVYRQALEEGGKRSCDGQLEGARQR